VASCREENRRDENIPIAANRSGPTPVGRGTNMPVRPAQTPAMGKVTVFIGFNAANFSVRQPSEYSLRTRFIRAGFQLFQPQFLYIRAMARDNYITTYCLRQGYNMPAALTIFIGETGFVPPGLTPEWRKHRLACRPCSAILSVRILKHRHYHE